MADNLKPQKHSRGYLPHFNVEQATQFVTFRLADSMPQTLLKFWKSELERGECTDVDFRKRIEQYLDQGYGSCALSDYRVAAKIRETLFKWDDERYTLVAWVIMPNHVHILIKLLEANSLSEIMHSIKYNALDKIIHCSRGEQDIRTQRAVLVR
ncbi:MAG: transposase [Pyrinomonadaceae bacterium]